LNDGVDVPRIETIAGGFLTIHLDVQIGLTEHVKNSEIGNAAHLLHLSLNLGGEFLQNFQIRADDLDRIGAFDARDRFLDIVLDILREIEGGPGHRIGELPIEVLDQLRLCIICRPFVERLERREYLDVGERRGITAIVRPAMLGHRRKDLRVAHHDLAQFCRRRSASIQPHRRGHRHPDPQIAFFQMRQKFAAEPRAQQSNEDKKSQTDREHGLAMVQGPAKNRLICRAQGRTTIVSVSWTCSGNR